MNEPNSKPPRRRNEPPVLVIEPGRQSPATTRRRANEASARNLEAMVQDLLGKVREAEGQLREKEQAIADLHDQTVTMAQKLLQDKAASGAAKAPRGKPPAASAAAPVEPAAATSNTCPTCGRHMRKAKCVNVLTLVCLSCQGVFLDARAVRQIARTLPWMRYVEQFLGSAGVQAEPGKLARSPADVPDEVESGDPA